MTPTHPHSFPVEQGTLSEKVMSLLRDFARQKLPSELDEHEEGGADYEGAYTIFVERSRAIIDHLTAAPPAQSREREPTMEEDFMLRRALMNSTEPVPPAPQAEGEIEQLLKNAGLTSRDGTFVSAPTREIAAALRSLQAPPRTYADGIEDAAKVAYDWQPPNHAANAPRQPIVGGSMSECVRCHAPNEKWEAFATLYRHIATQVFGDPDPGELCPWCASKLSAERSAEFITSVPPPSAPSPRNQPSKEP